MTKRSPERETFLSDVLTTAYEGGIGYWARAYDAKTIKNDRGYDGYSSITVVDHQAACEGLDLDLAWSYEQLDEVQEDGRASQWVYTVTLESIASAIAKILEPGSSIALARDYVERIGYANRSNDADLDAFDADAIFQVAALGDVIYG